MKESICESCDEKCIAYSKCRFVSKCDFHQNDKFHYDHNRRFNDIGHDEMYDDAFEDESLILERNK